MLIQSAIGLNDRSASPSKTATDVLDFEVLKAFEKVKSEDGSDIVVELIDLYLNSTPQRIQQIKLASAATDWILLERAAHTLKGSSSTLGLHPIARVCQELENAATNRGDSLDDLVASLESRFVEAREALIAERDRRS
jgi:HPt (histidine-containing phosphotransfer) domain-containing protein